MDLGAEIIEEEKKEIQGSNHINPPVEINKADLFYESNSEQDEQIKPRVINNSFVKDEEEQKQAPEEVD